MFHSVIKQRAADEVLFKTYISSMKMFEFGPLPAGQEAELYVHYCFWATFCLTAVSKEVSKFIEQTGSYTAE